jgi:hypothetical protein
MRRPLDWITVSIASLALFAGHWRADADVPAGLRASEAPHPALPTQEETSPFAYIREDGSEVYLPLNGVAPRPASIGRESSATQAVFTWSAQTAIPERDFPVLQ